MYTEAAIVKQLVNRLTLSSQNQPWGVGGGGGGTLGFFVWEYPAGTLEPLTYTRASSAEFCYLLLDLTSQNPLATILE